MPPKSGYMAYAEEVRDEVKAELQKEGQPGSVAEVGKRTGERWRALDEATKEKYNRMANEAMEREKQAKEDEGGEDKEKDEAEKAGDQGIPLARVKRIAKMDKDVGQLNSDAAKALKRSAELFAETLAQGCFDRMREHGRRQVKYQDLEETVLKQPRLGFLQDHVYSLRPKEGSKPQNELPVDTSNQPISSFFHAVSKEEDDHPPQHTEQEPPQPQDGSAHLPPSEAPP